MNANISLMRRTRPRLIVNGPPVLPNWLPGIALAPALLCSAQVHAEFALNFSGGTSTSILHGSNSTGGQTPFSPVGNNQAGGESVVDPSNGIRYWHYILGDPASGFAQDVYIQSTGGTGCTQNTICTASGGSTAQAPDFNLLSNNVNQTGNGSGNPNRVIVRQVIGGSWNAATSTWSCDTAFCSEFIKSSYANKPKITQGINAADFTSTFILDMSAIALSNNSTDLTVTSKDSPTTGASLTIAQQVIDTGTGNAISSFDIAKDAQTTFVTGGKYTYTTGGGVLGARGSYVYVDGGYNLSAVDYTPFINNVDDANPWAYPTGKP